jgi:hypothetical protein
VGVGVGAGVSDRVGVTDGLGVTETVDELVAGVGVSDAVGTSLGSSLELGDAPNPVPAVLPSTLVHTMPEMSVSPGSSTPHSTELRPCAGTARVAAPVSAVPECALPALSVTTVRVASIVTG